MPKDKGQKRSTIISQFRQHNSDQLILESESWKCDVAPSDTGGVLPFTMQTGGIELFVKYKCEKHFSVENTIEIMDKFPCSFTEI